MRRTFEWASDSIPGCGTVLERVPWFLIQQIETARRTRHHMPDADRQPVLARHADAERRRKSGVKRDEIRAQRLAPVGIEAGRQRPWSGRSRSRTSPTPPRRSARGSTTPPRSNFSSKAWPSRSRMRSGLPHSNGDGGAGGGGGGMYALHHLEHLEQVAVREPRRERDPPALAARRAPSPAPRLPGGWRTSRRTSTPPRRSSRPRTAGPRRRRAGTRSAGCSASALAAAASSRSVAMSTPITMAPRRATTRDVQPVPVARSRIRSPRRGFSRSTQCSIESAMPRLIAL